MIVCIYDSYYYFIKLSIKLCIKIIMELCSSNVVRVLEHGGFITCMDYPAVS